ncbi:hypothetical protein I6A84_38050 [Frankia sp. CNm7]|uniref:Uncharacterized protein n=1 Tax=Frankia nepalensis TaxID=1836974 RepID=A0A937RJ56_9ACTN|nr:hypothetical protein [Frankia nepalensis]MBL7495736.1 hypothetical protein [Frankia nepalensis]MBL7509010.1 hypothetical protein [Frankia nepalensis]MBL7523689.1 hypothetical protein [Frankia nepalensis]MBL7629809.1 hypothetical protein [Frankia nepalensis]
MHRSDVPTALGLGGHEWTTYHSDLGGLVWGFEGVMTAHVGDRRRVLTPRHAVRLPARRLAEVIPNVASRAMYVEWSTVAHTDRAARVQAEPETGALLRELAGTADPPTAWRLWPRVVAGLAPPHDGGPHVPMPRDPRGQALALAPMDEAADHRRDGYRGTVGYLDAFRAHFRATPGRFYRGGSA